MNALCPLKLLGLTMQAVSPCRSHWAKGSRCDRPGCKSAVVAGSLPAARIKSRALWQTSA